jgi:hypothetical protein
MPIDVSAMTPEQAVELYNRVRQSEGVTNDAVALIEFAKAVTGDGFDRLLREEKSKLESRIAEIDSALST